MRYGRLLGLARRSLCTTAGGNGNGNVDPAEVAKFARQAASWWHPQGSAAPLHRLNPLRLSYIRAAIEKNVLTSPSTSPDDGSDSSGELTGDGTDMMKYPLNGYRIIDVGCGGLVTEPLTRLGATVLGVDMSGASIKAAESHMLKDRTLSKSNRLTYRTSSIESIVTEQQTFDVVLALEVIEHVPDAAHFLTQLARATRPGGILVLSTINRTLMSFALAKVGAEYVARWLPPGTHQWDKFMAPEEVQQILHERTTLRTQDVVGVQCNPVSMSFHMADDTSVNYMLTACRPLEEREDGGVQIDCVQRDG